MLNPMDHARIGEAVRKAEEGTTGEVLVVLASEVSHYPEIALGWATAVALVTPAVGLALGVHPLAIASHAGLWLATQASARKDEVLLALVAYALVQAALFIVVLLALEIPPVRRALTPAMLKRHKVERAARQQFAAISARAQGSDTGVLLFVALVDRQVRVLADKSLHDKADEAAWTAAATAVGQAIRHGKDPTSGIVQAVEICGSVLRAHFPSSQDPRGQVFIDHPVEI